MKGLEVFLLPHWMGCWSFEGLPPESSLPNYDHLYTYVKRSTVKLKFLSALSFGVKILLFLCVLFK